MLSLHHSHAMRLQKEERGSEYYTNGFSEGGSSIRGMSVTFGSVVRRTGVAGGDGRGEGVLTSSTSRALAAAEVGSWGLHALWVVLVVLLLEGIDL